MAADLIGRSDELAALVRVLDATARGERTAAVVSGDAGVGKTRLLSELRTHAESAGMRVLVGHCLDLGAVGIPYLAFTEMFARTDREVLEPSRRATRAELFESVLDVVASLASEQPVLVIVEDVHWAETSTRELITFLLSRLDSVRVAFVISYRSDDLHRRHPLRQALSEWTRMAFVTRIELSALDPESSYLLLDAIEPPGTDVAARRGIVERAGGNPFFL